MSIQLSFIKYIERLLQSWSVCMSGFGKFKKRGKSNKDPRDARG